MHPRCRNSCSRPRRCWRWALAPAAAGPEGGTVVGGAATIQGGGTAVTINQSSSRAIINWNTFNIGVGETIRFNQPAAPRSRSTAYRRARPLADLGTLTANGRVFVINRDGILFGPTRSSTRPASSPPPTTSATTTSWPAGYNFNIPGRPDASIVNQGPHHGRRAAASPRWWRRACAIPAPSRPRSARSRSAPATASRSTSTATG